jgi:putative ubiquitin-RnfH superfamily antitoxin RatB of RatAB toxin-antitoxin module
LHTFIPEDAAMDLSFALNKYRLFGSSHHHEHELHNEDRVRISRSRRAIELQDQELIQLALLEERQNSA